MPQKLGGEEVESNVSVEFETSELMVVRERTTVRFRCFIDLTDLGDHESLSQFIVRHNGIAGTRTYLRSVLNSEVRRSMGLRLPGTPG